MISLVLPELFFFFFSLHIKFELCKTCTKINVFQAHIYDDGQRLHPKLKLYSRTCWSLWARLTYTVIYAPYLKPYLHSLEKAENKSTNRSRGWHCQGKYLHLSLEKDTYVRTFTLLVLFLRRRIHQALYVQLINSHMC